MIQNGIEEILCVTDPHNSAKYWYSFTNKASYLMSYIKKYGALCIMDNFVAKR